MAWFKEETFPCTYKEQMDHENANQTMHENRQDSEPEHSDSECWCCCRDCWDLKWHHGGRSGSNHVPA